MQTWTTDINSPVGTLRLVADAAGLRRIAFLERGESLPLEANWRVEPARLQGVVAQLERYFAGTLRDFDLALAPEGTEFRRRVWDALLAIPYGETRSYGALAAVIGNPKAARAVGLANGANPIPIVIPCHRVIGSSGALVGYGGGLDIKVRLLAIERGQSVMTA